VTSAIPAEPPERGSRIGRFLVTGVVSAGRHATVLQARDDESGFVSLKTATSEVGAALLACELRALKALGADGGPAPRLVHSDAKAEGWRAAAWIQGSDPRIVAAELRDAGESQELAGLLRSIAAAYAALHARGVMHGQVHPRHILVDYAGRAGIVDLSMAVGAADGPPAAGLEACLGSLSAPEHACAVLEDRAPALTPESEQYSLAALLFLLATGRSYTALRLRREDLPHDIVSLPPLPFAEHGVASWPELEAVLRRALAKDPGVRFASVGDLARALANVEQSAGTAASALPCRPAVRPAGAGGLARVLADFRRAAASDEALAGLVAPTCSISYGAGGVGWALTRIGTLTGDESALSDAERWLTEAERRSTNPDAFDDGDELTSAITGPVSPFHRESGIAVTRAYLAAATGDKERHQAALNGYCAATAEPCHSLDLTLGRSSVLLVAAQLLRQADRSWPATGRLMRHGDAICAAVWHQAVNTDVAYNGIAHGLAGLAYAAMMWARERGAPPPEGVRPALDRLASVAEPHGRGMRWALSPPGGPGADAFWLGWCHGSAGYVFLWNLARETYGDDAYGALAEQAAWPLDRTAGATSLCCGTAGMAYAALNMHRSDDDDRWRSLATRLAERSASNDALAGDATSPLSLYKGHIGLALLAIELEDPGHAAMPLFEADAAVTVPFLPAGSVAPLIT
jgi:hypothetical protein